MRDKGAAPGGDGRSGVEPALDELYATPPSGFVARRTELATAARADGRAEDARTLRAARRPTLGAWAANLLLRAEPEESRRFLELGRSLREAYRTLDAAGLKELSARRRSVVAALSGQAVRHAEEAGHRLSDAVRQDVEETLRAVLADPDAAERWAGGRLERGLAPPSDFPAGGTRADRPAPERPSPKRTSAKKAPVRDELAERHRAREQRLARAREAARQAEERLGDRRAEEADSGAELERAGERVDAAREQVSEAERALREAREELERAERERRDAEEAHGAAADALADAERAARRAYRELERSGRSSSR
ncbi:hypothetical protein [Streptomyces sp. NBC_00670]|uniref:hypothetical protein n=1 Tax=Streptomyces sp. NBC_00670 TaxID=2975804 RepID=UPI002E30A9F9|nr:hypothetical protein [Streptomyces sp. NBC_00670]